jgi:dienelactone hydrolase
MHCSGLAATIVLLCANTLAQTAVPTSTSDPYPPLPLPKGFVRERMTVLAAYTNPEQTRHLTALIYRPPGKGPFPLVIVSHGRPSDATAVVKKMTPDYNTTDIWLAEQGFVVLAALRPGYGTSEGLISDRALGYNSGGHTCSNPDYFDAADHGAVDILAVLDFMRQQSYVDAQHVILLGHSAGGWDTIGAISHNPPGVIGAVLFAPGAGSDGHNHVCRENYLVDAARRFGTTAKVPTVWIVVENDKYFTPRLEESMFAAFRAQHPPSQDVFVSLPAFGADGHQIVAEGIPGMEIWAPPLQKFLESLGSLQNQ